MDSPLFIMLEPTDMLDRAASDHYMQITGSTHGRVQSIPTELIVGLLSLLI